jgi:hypothetical protein
MPYVFNASLYCDSCGGEIMFQLGPAQCDSQDSDTYPQYVSLESSRTDSIGESDSINHCASEAECLERVDLSDYGLRPTRGETRLVARTIYRLSSTQSTISG